MGRTFFSHNREIRPSTTHHHHAVSQSAQSVSAAGPSGKLHDKVDCGGRMSREGRQGKSASSSSSSSSSSLIAVAKHGAWPCHVAAGQGALLSCRVSGVQKGHSGWAGRIYLGYTECVGVVRLTRPTWRFLTFNHVSLFGGGRDGKARLGRWGNRESGPFHSTKLHISCSLLDFYYRVRGIPGCACQSLTYTRFRVN